MEISKNKSRFNSKDRVVVGLKGFGKLGCIIKDSVRWFVSGILAKF